MPNRNKLISALLVAIIIPVSLLGQACSSSSEAEKTLVEYLKARGVKDVAIDILTNPPDNADRAYIAATLTHNFATAEGKPQKEYKGYILTRSEGKWIVEGTTKYTKDTNKALEYLAGSK